MYYEHGFNPDLYVIIQGGVHEMRVGITLACAECKNRNYASIKNKKNNPDRLEVKKYCKFCKTHTSHKETK
jgi:large subunit ribosomal protein L33